MGVGGLPYPPAGRCNTHLKHGAGPTFPGEPSLQGVSPAPRPSRASSCGPGFSRGARVACASPPQKEAPLFNSPPHTHTPPINSEERTNTREIGSSSGPHLTTSKTTAGGRAKYWREGVAGRHGGRGREHEKDLAIAEPQAGGTTGGNTHGAPQRICGCWGAISPSGLHVQARRGDGARLCLPPSPPHPRLPQRQQPR